MDFSNPVHSTPSELLELEKHLGVVLPKKDIWGNDIEYFTDLAVPSFSTGGPMPQNLLIRSLNADGDEDEHVESCPQRRELGQGTKVEEEERPTS